MMDGNERQRLILGVMAATFIFTALFVLEIGAVVGMQPSELENVCSKTKAFVVNGEIYQCVKVKAEVTK